MSICISRQHHEQLLKIAALAAPDECCGLLMGHGNHVENIVETANVAPFPRKQFEIDPSALIKAERDSRSGKQGLIGYFHSHPNKNPEPSKIDAEMAAADGKYWIIIAGENMSAWRSVRSGAVYSRFDPVELDTAD
jgi:desampylase